MKKIKERKKYLEKYGLNEAPYSTNPDERFLFLTTSHKEAIGLISHTIELKEGACLIIGDAGTGKTTIMRRIASLLHNEEDISVGVIENGGHMTSRFQLIKEILETFNIECKGQDQKTRIDQLKDFLLEEYKGKRTPVLLIDEAQEMPAKLLEELRGYLNIETATEKLLQIVLFAMPKINKRLPYAKSLKSRLTKTELERMNREEAEDMLRWRFIQSGGKLFPFDKESLDLLYSLTKGVPRALCGIAQLALETSASDNVPISVNTIREVSKFKSLD